MLSSLSKSSSKFLTRAVFSASRIRRPITATNTTATTAAAAAMTTATATTATATKIRAIVFDVDDCLYDVASGFTAHRNGEIIWRYMVEKHGFPSAEEARAVRDEYFARYHSTAKALTIAQSEGRFPVDDPRGSVPFDPKDMSRYWVDHLEYDKLWKNPRYETVDDSVEAKRDFAAALDNCPAKLIAFSNGPRAYVMKVLDTLGYLHLFSSSSSSSDGGDTKDGAFLWGVDDVLPHCKPEPEAFRKIFDALEERKDGDGDGDGGDGPIRPEDCVMVEDSMKNLRAAKALGMKTVLVTGSREEGRILAEDAPSADEPYIDAAVTVAEELPAVLPGLWRDPPVFEPPEPTVPASPS